MKKQQFIAFIVLSGLAFATIFSSCSENRKHSSETLRVGIPGKVNVLKPELAHKEADRLVCRMIYGVPVKQPDAASPFVVALAKDWLVNIDSSRFIIYLNENVYYNPSEIFGKNGNRAATALDIVATIKNYIVKQKEAGKGAGVFEHLQGVEFFYDRATSENFLSVPLDGLLFSDDHTLVFEYYEPEKQFFQHLSDIALAIRPLECFEKKCSEAVGFGMFTIKEANEQKIVLELSPAGKEIEGLSYNRIEVLQNLTQERIIQYLSEGTLDMVMDAGDDLVKAFLESNIHRINVPNPDFRIVEKNGYYRIFATSVDTTLLSAF